MAYKISKPLQKRIREMYLAGVQFSTIARETGLNRDTVAKYAREVDDDIDIDRVPAARFTSQDVDRLKALAELVLTMACDRCETKFGILVNFPDGKNTGVLHCPRCKERIPYIIRPPTLSKAEMASRAAERRRRR